MAITAYWVDESKTIIRYDFEGHWDWDIFYPVYNQVVEMATSVDHRVDVVLDLRKNTTFPKNIIMHIQSIANKRPANMGKSVIVTKNRFARSLYRVASKISARIGQNYYIMPTFDDAYAFITEDRQGV